ncbi:MAG: hypothetical protein AB1466_05150 [Actinomycetota bacterium]
MAKKFILMGIIAALIILTFPTVALAGTVVTNYVTTTITGPQTVAVGEPFSINIIFETPLDGGLYANAFPTLTAPPALDLTAVTFTSTGTSLQWPENNYTISDVAVFDEFGTTNLYSNWGFLAYNPTMLLGDTITWNYSGFVALKPGDYTFTLAISGQFWNLVTGVVFIDPSNPVIVTHTVTAVPTLGVAVSLSPTSIIVNPGEVAAYTISVQNEGALTDTYNLSVDYADFDGLYLAYPTRIQPTWVSLGSTSVTLAPGETIQIPLTITPPEDWAGMENAIYGFTVTAVSQTDPLVKASASASLTLQATKRSMVEYIDLELEELYAKVDASTINPGIKANLLSTIDKAITTKEQALEFIISGNEKKANNKLFVTSKTLVSFIDTVTDLSGIEIPVEIATEFIQEAQTMIDHLQIAIVTPL